MSLEARLVAELEQLLGHERIYRARLPEGALLPALTYQRVSTVHGYAHDGDDELHTARVQVDCWADSPDDADAQAEAGPLALSGFGADDAELQRIEVADDRELDEPEAEMWRRSIDLLIAYAPAAGS